VNRAPLPPVLRALDRASARLLDAAAWLALPLALLLCLQWPLRDLVQAHSRLANDLGQCVFALYAAFGLWQATRHDAHLHPDAIARRLWSPAARRRLKRWGVALGVLPWSAFVLWQGAPQVWQSVRQLEAFPDSFNPGYFVIKLAMALLAAAMLLQGGLDLLGADPDPDPDPEADA
jgi:TRAP-type mannitol/chloroaromatic compound transport system permease small subunit